MFRHAVRVSRDRPYGITCVVFIRTFTNKFQLFVLLRGDKDKTFTIHAEDYIFKHHFSCFMMFSLLYFRWGHDVSWSVRMTIDTD